MTPVTDYVTPDDKDWTWVLHRPCPECGFDVRRMPAVEVAERARTAAEEWVQILNSSPAVDARPEPSVWSPLEYGCHVRDVFRIFDIRLDLMLSEDDPTFANWNQDEEAVAEGYGEQDPERVADELAEAAGTFADRLQAVDGPEWQRTGQRSDGARFTVATVSQYFLHDVIHHLWDVTGQTDATESLVLE